MKIPAAVALCFAAATLVAATPERASAQEVVLRYAGTLPVSHHVTRAQARFAELVAEKTGGKVKVEHYPAGQLYKAHDIPTAIATGSLDIGDNLVGVWTNDAISEINDIPFLYRDGDHATKAWQRDGELFKLYTEKMRARQIMPLGVTFIGSLFDFSSKTPLRTPADFKGRKIRSYGALASEALRALGASPVTMDPGEMYLGLQSGTIDAAITAITTLNTRKLWEAAGYATITEAGYGVFPMNMNLRKYESLSPEFQKALTDASWEVSAWSAEQAGGEDAKSLEFLRGKIEVTVLDAAAKKEWQTLLEPVVESWKSRADPREAALIEWIRGL